MKVCSAFEKPSACVQTVILASQILGTKVYFCFNVILDFNSTCMQALIWALQILAHLCIFPAKDNLEKIFEMPLRRRCVQI